jgi:hypothetical protein
LKEKSGRFGEKLNQIKLKQLILFVMGKVFGKKSSEQLQRQVGKFGQISK